MSNAAFTDVTRFTPASGGTGSFVVSAAVTGYQTPLTAGASNFNYRYRAESADLTQWEVGTGAYTSSNVTLTRTPIFNSAAGSSAINFTVAPQVAFVSLAEDYNVAQIAGSTAADTANAGNLGEFVSATVSSGAAITLTTATAANVTSIALSAGDWQLTGNVIYQPGTAAVPSGFVSWLSSVSATTPTPPNGGGYAAIQGVFTTGGLAGTTAGNMRASLSASATYFLGALATFSSNMTAYGHIEARRLR